MPSSDHGSLADAQRKWDTEDVTQARSVAWLALDQVNAETWRNFSGDVGPAVHINRLLAADGKREGLTGAALVCGDMQSERGYFEGLPDVSFQHVDGYDISLESAKRYEPNGLTFTPHQVDCNRLDLPQNKYDLIVVSHGAHHVYNLGNLFYQANKALTDRGLFFMYEWIGPTYLQFPLRNRLVSLALLYALFDRPSRTTHMGKVKGLRYIQDAPDQFDPSEACNSTEIMPQFQKYFEVVTCHPHGALAYPIFEGLAQHVDQTHRPHRRRVHKVLRVERILTRLRLIEPLFVVALGRKRPGVF